MKKTNFRSPNKKNEEKPKETSPDMKKLYLSIYRSGYEQGAIDLYEGKIQVDEDERGYTLRKTDEKPERTSEETK